MDYSTAGQALARDDEGVLFDVRSLYAHLQQVADPRSRRGRRYPLALILLAVLLAKLAGEDKPHGIAAWVRARATLLIQTFDLAYPAMPCANTYRNVLGEVVAVTELEAHFEQFLAQSADPGRAGQVAIDGKTVRGTIPVGATHGLHLLAAYQVQTGLVLKQVAVDGHENELSAAPRLLERLDLSGKIVTGDALFAQRDLSQAIVAAGGDYVWTVKENQPRLRSDIEHVFAPDVPLAPGFNRGASDFRTAQTVNTGHGRIERRTLTTSSLLTALSDWPGIGQVFKLERETHLPARHLIRQEVVYGVTSLTTAEADPRRLLRLVRAHWRIENCLHYRRDVTFQEDAGRTQAWNLAYALATFNNLVLALLLRAGYTNLAQARRHFAAHPDEALRLLLSAPA